MSIHRILSKNANTHAKIIAWVWNCTDKKGRCPSTSPYGRFVWKLEPSDYQPIFINGRFAWKWKRSEIIQPRRGRFLLLWLNNSPISMGEILLTIPKKNACIHYNSLITNGLIFIQIRHSLIGEFTLLLHLRHHFFAQAVRNLYFRQGLTPFLLGSDTFPSRSDTFSRALLLFQQALLLFHPTWLLFFELGYFFPYLSPF